MANINELSGGLQLNINTTSAYKIQDFEDECARELFI